MHSRSLARYAALLMLATAGLVHASSLQDVALRYRWTQGETVRYRATQVATADMDMPGTDAIRITSNLSQLQQLTVDNVAADGTATIRMTFESLKVDVSTPAGVMSYDSAAPAAGAGNQMADVMAKSYGAIVGQTITLAVTPSGEIRSIEGLDALAKKMTGNMPPDVAFSTADSLRAVVEQCFAALPNRVVHPGEAWNHARKMKTGFGTVESAMTFALKGVETRNGRQLASLTVAGKNTVTMDPNAGANLPNPMAMSVSMGSATSQGELLVDVKTGRLHRSSVQSMRADERRITAPDGSAINVDAVTKTTHTVELVEK